MPLLRAQQVASRETAVIQRFHMRTCIFCEGRAGSNEHVWPLWLMRKLLPNVTGTMKSERGENTNQTWKSASPELKVKFVCATCNNGWMSTLEVQVTPIIEELLGNNSITINSEDQKILSRWAVKNSMVLEALRLNQPWFYTLEERKAVMNNIQLPLRTFAWLAKCIEFNGVLSMSDNLSGITSLPRGKATGYVTTMAFGTLVIQILSLRSPAGVSANVPMKLHMKPNEFDVAITCISPEQQSVITWPRSHNIIGERGIQAFNDRWVPKSKKSMLPG